LRWMPLDSVVNTTNGVKGEWAKRRLSDGAKVRMEALLHAPRRSG
jgi:hypothetical protein